MSQLVEAPPEVLHLVAGEGVGGIDPRGEPPLGQGEESARDDAGPIELLAAPTEGQQRGDRPVQEREIRVLVGGHRPDQISGNRPGLRLAGLAVGGRTSETHKMPRKAQERHMLERFQGLSSHLSPWSISPCGILRFQAMSIYAISRIENFWMERGVPC